MNTKAARTRIRRMAKKNDLLNKEIKKLQAESSELKNSIILALQKIGKKELAFSNEEKVVVRQNTYTNYNYDLLIPTFRSKLIQKDFDDLVKADVVYKIDENHLITLIKKKKLKLNDVKSGIYESKSNPFLMTGKRDKTNVKKESP